MTRDEAYVLWCQACELDPDDPESREKYEKAQREDYDSFLADIEHERNHR